MFFVRLLIKAFLILILLLCLVVAGLLWWFNSFLSKPESVETIRAFVSNAAGVPVQFGRVELNIVKGITVEQVSAENPPAVQEKKLLTTSRVMLAYNVLALLQKHVDITDVSFVSPQLALELDPNNKVVFPLKETPEPRPSTAEKSWLDDVEVEIRSFNISNGGLVIKASDGTERFRIVGLNNNAKMKQSAAGFNASGQAKIGQMFLSKLLITDLQSPYTLGQGVLALPTIAGKAYRGTLTGAFEQKINHDELPFTFKLVGAQFDLNEMLKQLADKPDYISGQFSANTMWRGAMTNPRGISGKGDFEVVNGQLIQLGFFQQLAQVLGVKELAQPDFTKCRSEFTVENEVVNLSSFLLNSTLFDFSTTGTVGFDTVLNLNCELIFKPDLVKLLPNLVADRLVTRADGARTVAFAVTGTTEKPQSDLWLKLAIGPTGDLQQGVQQGIDALKNLFR